jgi:hypothetical protein
LAPTDTLELAVAIGAQTSAIFACGDWESSLETRFSTPDRSRQRPTLNWNINGQSGDDRQMPVPFAGEAIASSPSDANSCRAFSDKYKALELQETLAH